MCELGPAAEPHNLRLCKDVKNYDDDDGDDDDYYYYNYYYYYH